VVKLCRGVTSKLSGEADLQKYVFTRMDTDDCGNDDERLSRQIQNLLNFTKTSNSHYAAQQFPAAYHTININGQKVLGQRDPSQRLASVPVDFRGKTVLDLGCNQGGMVFQISGLVKWAVGVDYDSRMINAANRIADAIGASNTSFYVLDLQKGPLALISDFLPEQRVDICFLLSVCAWLNNWREVVDFAQSKSDSMLFETTGSSIQQQQQIDHLRMRYRAVELLAGTSEDDPIQKERKLFYLTEPVPIGVSSAATRVPDLS
jgi:SAM-dependent methyltransferase